MIAYFNALCDDCNQTEIDEEIRKLNNNNSRCVYVIQSGGLPELTISRSISDVFFCDSTSVLIIEKCQFYFDISWLGDGMGRMRSIQFNLRNGRTVECC